MIKLKLEFILLTILSSVILFSCTKPISLTKGGWTDDDDQCMKESPTYMRFDTTGYFYYCYEYGEADSMNIELDGRWKLKGQQIILSSHDSIPFSLQYKDNKVWLTKDGKTKELHNSDFWWNVVIYHYITDSVKLRECHLKDKNLTEVVKSIQEDQHKLNKIPLDLNILNLNINPQNDNKVYYYFDTKYYLNKNSIGYEYIDNQLVTYSGDISFLEFTPDAKTKTFYLYKIDEGVEDAHTYFYGGEFRISNGKYNNLQKHYIGPMF